MNKQEKYMDDLLRQYIIPESTEKAPEGFTSKVMTRVQYDTIAEMSGSSRLVPVISALVAVLFIVTALLLPESQTDNLTQPFLSILKNLGSSVAISSMSSIFRLTLPSVTLYVIIGIFVLTLFDRALHGFFKKEK